MEIVTTSGRVLNFEHKVYSTINHVEYEDDNGNQISATMYRIGRNPEVHICKCVNDFQEEISFDEFKEIESDCNNINSRN